jgi:hypothetical protein
MTENRPPPPTLTTIVKPPQVFSGTVTISLEEYRELIKFKLQHK